MYPSAAGRPALLVLLPGTGHGQGIRRHILGDGGAGRNVGALAHRHRGDQVGVAADEGVVADGTAELLEPVVIGGDSAAAEVDALAYIGVAHISEMGHFGPRAQRTVL